MDAFVGLEAFLGSFLAMVRASMVAIHSDRIASILLTSTRHLPSSLPLHTGIRTEPLRLPSCSVEVGPIVSFRLSPSSVEASPIVSTAQSS